MFQERYEYDAALQFAIKREAMYRLLHSRTRFCLTQNPRQAKSAAEGFDFAGNMRETIRPTRLDLTRLYFSKYFSIIQRGCH